ncbi:hypothetical protein [Streptomyces sp. CH-036]|uniref:hypothetical protein n=1 Tax=Streptomyces sp. CH-036 TaxID=3406733 RepID=UPI003C735026
MLHRGLKFVHAAVLAFSVVMAFLFVRGLDEIQVISSSAVIDVLDSNDTVSAARVVQEAREFSSEHGAGVAREVPDLKNPDEIRHLYLVSGKDDEVTGSWLKDGYPDFNRNIETRVHPIADIEQLDPRGAYHVFGDDGAVDILAADFRDLGLTVNVYRPLSYSMLASNYSEDPLFWSFCVVALAAMTLTGASVLLRAKTYGVLRLQGKSFAAILIRDFRQLAVFWMVSLASTAAATLAFLGIYNDFAALGIFASIAAGTGILLLLAVLIVHVSVLALTFKVDILPALKGVLPTRSATISLYVVRVPALLLCLSIAMNVTWAGQDLLTREQNQKSYSGVGDAVSIRLSGAYATRLDELDKHVGPWLRQADERGDVIVAGRGDLQITAADARLPPGEILIVNDTYLDKQRLVDGSGRRYASGARNGEKPDARPVRVIIPESFGSHVPTIVKAVREKLDPSADRNIPLEVLGAASGQQLFGYNTGSLVFSSTQSSDEDRSFVRNPIVVVVPNGSTFLTNDAYGTFATQEGIIFTDREDALNGIEQKNLHNYVSSISLVGQRTSQELREAVSEFRLQLFNLIVAVMVILIAGVGTCIIYTRKNAQLIFARHISGWKYAATHRFILAVELAIAVIFVTQIPLRVWRHNQEVASFAAAGLPTPFPPMELAAVDLAVIGALAAFELGVVLLALMLFHRRVVRERASGA